VTQGKVSEGGLFVGGGISFRALEGGGVGDCAGNEGKLHNSRKISLTDIEGHGRGEVLGRARLKEGRGKPGKRTITEKNRGEDFSLYLKEERSAQKK